MSPGHWFVLSLTVLPPDKPGRNPSVNSEEQEKGLQAGVCSSLHIFLQQQPSQTGQFPAVRAAGQGGHSTDHACPGTQSNGQPLLCEWLICKAPHAMWWVRQAALQQAAGLAASQQETKPLASAWNDLRPSFYHFFFLFSCRINRIFSSSACSELCSCCCCWALTPGQLHFLDAAAS